MTTSATTLYGFTALPADITKSPPKSATSPSTYSVSQLPPPSSALATRVSTYAKSKLSRHTYHHCWRVYSYGLAIVRDFFPQYNVHPGSKLEETYFLTCMLHDIGTAEEFMLATKLSFEFWGAIHALQVLQHAEMTGGEGGVASREQAESVVEAILRHQDVQDKGKITLITRLIHLGTLFDNAGMHKEWVSRETIENVSREFPREGWCGCFKKVVEEEWREKPWTMCSRIEDFPELIERNASEGGLMAEFE